MTVTNPGTQTGTVGTAASLQIHAADSAAGQTLSYSAAGLPAGLAINASTGLISGTPTAAATSTITVTVKDGTGAAGTASFAWNVASSGGGGEVVAPATSSIRRTVSGQEGLPPRWSSPIQERPRSTGGR